MLTMHDTLYHGTIYEILKVDVSSSNLSACTLALPTR